MLAGRWVSFVERFRAQPHATLPEQRLLCDAFAKYFCLTQFLNTLPGFFAVFAGKRSKDK